LTEGALNREKTKGLWSKGLDQQLSTKVCGIERRRKDLYRKREQIPTQFCVFCNPARDRSFFNAQEHLDHNLPEQKTLGLAGY
jgi:hypothetical protein